MSDDEWTHREWIDVRTPIDDLEPLDDTHTEMRDFAIRSIEILHSFAVAIESAISRPNATVRDISVAFWQVAYALGLPACEDSMTTKAAQLGVERATISKGATAFARANDLEPSWHMKRECLPYTEARLAAVAHSNGNGNGELPPHNRAKPFKTPPELPPRSARAQ